MAELTTNPADPRLGHGADSAPSPQNDAYLVMDSSAPFVRPVRRSYVHLTREDGTAPPLVITTMVGLVGCGAQTTMSQGIAETYARAPKFYSSTYCVGCRMHLPVGEFHWDGTTEIVGS